MKISYDSWYYRVITAFSNWFASVSWEGLHALFNGGVYWSLTEADHDKMRELLKPNYYIILTRRKCHLTTYLISFASWVVTGKGVHYTHALMNVDDGNVRNDNDFRLMEATGTGVHFSTFMQVFDCDSVVFLRPKGYTDHDWQEALDGLLEQEGKKYDNLFDIADDTRVSCVEMCREALMQEDEYYTKFVNLEALITKHGNNLTPQMLYDCGDFEIAFEVRR